MKPSHGAFGYRGGIYTYLVLRPEEFLGRELTDEERRYAPSGLYVVGKWENRRRVAIVGTRSPEGIDLYVTRKVVERCVKRGEYTVSGLAKGVDTEVHRATIELGGRSVAVIPTPLDVCYPAENEALYLELLRNHVVISPFRFEKRLEKKDFVVRNHVIALISDEVIITAAGDTSGTRYVAEAAVDMGRKLYVTERVVRARPMWLKDLRGWEVL